MKIQNIKVRILRIQRLIDILYIDIYYLSRMISKNDTSIYLNKKMLTIIHVYLCRRLRNFLRQDQPK